MSEVSKLRFALALLTGRLHQAQGDKRCGCGPCAHRIALAAKQAGVSRQRLVAALPAAAKAHLARRPRSAHTMQVRICESSAIRVRGGDVAPADGLAVLLARLHAEGR